MNYYPGEPLNAHELQEYRVLAAHYNFQTAATEQAKDARILTVAGGIFLSGSVAASAAAAANTFEVAKVIPEPTPAAEGGAFLGIAAVSLAVIGLAARMRARSMQRQINAFNTKLFGLNAPTD